MTVAQTSHHAAMLYAPASVRFADMVELIFLLLFVLVVNLPFGYWREGVNRFSFPWFVAVHAAVPLILGFRVLFGIPFEWAILPFAVIAYFAGQTIGARVRRRRMRDRPVVQRPDQSE